MPRCVKGGGEGPRRPVDLAERAAPRPDLRVHDELGIGQPSDCAGHGVAQRLVGPPALGEVALHQVGRDGPEVPAPVAGQAVRFHHPPDLIISWRQVPRPSSSSDLTGTATGSDVGIKRVLVGSCPMPSILDGVRILEVAEHTFVPAASALLSDLGADVGASGRRPGSLPWLCAFPASTAPLPPPGPPRPLPLPSPRCKFRGPRRPAHTTPRCLLPPWPPPPTTPLPPPPPHYDPHASPLPTGTPASHRSTFPPRPRLPTPSSPAANAPPSSSQNPPPPPTHAPPPPPLPSSAMAPPSRPLALPPHPPLLPTSPPPTRVTSSTEQREHS